MRHTTSLQSIQNTQLAESLLLACQDIYNIDHDMVDYVSQHLYIQSAMMLEDKNLTESQRKYYTAFFQSCSKLIYAENDSMQQQAIDEIKDFLA